MLGCTLPQHGAQFRLGHSQAVKSKAEWAAGYWRAGCCSDVVRGVVPHVAIHPIWYGQLQELLQEAVWGCGRLWTVR